MRLLLDTVTFIWAVDSPDLISRRAFSALRNPAAVREISSISFSEIAIKHHLGKLRMTKHDVSKGIDDLQLRVLPYSEGHAYQLFDVPLYHNDPFDRQIIAQALCEGIPVVTSDAKFHRYSGLRVIW
jgi:PIN domain nuclease of toxin-antitoxin system